MIINIGDDILKLRSLKLLNKVLIDKTTKKNILWATDAYKESGKAYNRDREITQDLITGRNADVIKTRARKAMEQQSLRTKQHAEVFTPLWIVKKMNDHADEVWFEHADVFFQENEPTEHIEFPPEKTWQQYVDSRRMEITCGEAPYLTTRYDKGVPARNGSIWTAILLCNISTDLHGAWGSTRPKNTLLMNSVPNKDRP